MTGARTVAVKNAAMLMRAMPGTSGVMSGASTTPTKPMTMPMSAPMTSIGANSPPGVSAA